MWKAFSTVLVGAAWAIIASVTAAPAQVTSLSVNKCLAGKLNGLGKSLVARSGCYGKEAAKGVAKPDCHQKASDKFTGGLSPAKGAFNKLDAKYPSTDAAACRTFDDQGSFEISMAAYAAGVPTTTGSTVGKCDAAKIKCVGKYVAAMAKCNASAASSTGAIDSACTAKAAVKLADDPGGCLAKAVLKGDCSNSGSQAVTLRAAADAWIQSALCALDPGNAGCLSVATITNVSCVIAVTPRIILSIVLDPVAPETLTAQAYLASDDSLFANLPNIPAASVNATRFFTLSSDSYFAQSFYLVLRRASDSTEYARLPFTCS